MTAGPSPLTREAPPDGSPAFASRAERGVGRRDPLAPRGMVRFLTKPAAFLAANWAAMLGILTVVGIVPALAGATRTTADVPEHEDTPFLSTLQHLRRTLWRDAPASALVVLVLAGIGVNALYLPALPTTARVVTVGLIVPVLWALITVLSAYVVTASRDQRAERTAIVLRTLTLVVQRPLAALLAPGLIVLLAPVWLLAPLTIACGFSVPPWVVARLWGEWSAADDG